MKKPPFLTHVTLNADFPIEGESFLNNLAFLKDLRLAIDSPVTFFVGENGSGKSTLLEAMAVKADLPIAGGGGNELAAGHGFLEESQLSNLIRLAYVKQPRDKYFFRAETHAHVASLLVDRQNDPEFALDPFDRYGGKSLHEMSHGEAFLAVMQHRFNQGLYFLDEPESALSPQRQLSMLALMHDLVKNGGSQFIIATHSPILLTFPGATILSFDSAPLQAIGYKDTTHYQVTKGVLDDPDLYWRHLGD
jgi:predicted ATPase